jgi:hypothetical protein
MYTLLRGDRVLECVQLFVIDNALSSTRVCTNVKALAVLGTLYLDTEVGVAAERNSVVHAWWRLGDQFLGFCICHYVVNRFWSRGLAWRDCSAYFDFSACYDCAACQVLE